MRRTLETKDFEVKNSSRGWYFRWKIWNEGTGVGFFSEEAEALSERDKYIELHNQGATLYNYSIESIEDEVAE